MEIVINDGQLLDAMLMQDGFSLLQGGAHWCGDEVLGGHELGDWLFKILYKANVTVGEDAGQLLVRGHDRDARDMILAHQCLGITHGGLWPQGEGIADHARL